LDRVRLLVLDLPLAPSLASLVRRGNRKACSPPIPKLPLHALLACALVLALLPAGEAVGGEAPRFDCATLAPPAELQFGVVAGDWNGDGKKDLAVTYLEKSQLGIFLNRGERRFEHTANIDIGDVPRGIAAGDVNGDGAVDFAVANASSNDVTLILGDGKGGSSKTSSLLTGIGPFEPALADFDGDGHLDLVSVNETNLGVEIKGQVKVLFGGKGPGLRAHSGGGVFNEMVQLQAGLHPADLAVGDFDGKNGPDFAVVNWLSASISVFLHGGGRQLEAAAELAIPGKLTYSIFAADFDRNGTGDLAATEIEGRRVHLFSGDGHGAFKAAGAHAVGAGARWVSGGDLDGDGNVDLVTADTGAGTVSLLMGDGKGGFAEAVAVRAGVGPRMVVAEDLDGDGKLDLAVTNGRSRAVILLWQTAGAGKPCPEIEENKRGRNDSGSSPSGGLHKSSQTGPSPAGRG
jgi:hypothetical protein